ncbi:MAG: hypothetical protein HQ542_01085 [Bacteroidia bacterium]|nr:hypothetical protein [Bacteroidia bacterium]
MKKIRAIITLAAFIAIPLLTLAQGPPPPPGQPGSPGNNTNQIPVGAPIGGGLGILLAMGLGYGGWKIYKIRKASEVDEAK